MQNPLLVPGWIACWDAGRDLGFGRPYYRRSVESIAKAGSILTE